MGDVAERAAVDEGRSALERLEQVGLERVPQEDGHRARDLEVLGRDRGAVLARREHDPAEPGPEVREVAREGEDRHDLGCDRDHELGLARVAVLLAAQADHDLAQRAVADVQDARPQHPVGVDAQGVAMVEVVVDERRGEVVRRADRVDVAREVEVEVLHRDDLAVSTAGRAALDPEHGPEGGLADRHRRPPADPVEPLGQADRGRRLALAQRRRADRGDDDVLAARVGASTRRIPSRVTLAFVLPYGSISSSWNPRSRATSMIGRGVRRGRSRGRTGRAGGARHERLPARCSASARAVGRLVLRRAHEVGEQQGVGHRPDAAGDRGDRGRDAAGRLEVDVAHQPVTDDVDPHVDHDRARRQHLAGDQAGDAGGDDDDLGVARVPCEIGRPRVADRDRRVLAEQQQGRRLADDVRASDHHGAVAGERDPGALQQLDRGMGGGRQEPLVAERHQPRVPWVQAVDVLGRVERVDHGRERDPLGERHLDDDAGDRLVGVELLDLAPDGRGRRTTRDLDQPALDADRRARPQDLVQVDGGRRVAPTSTMASVGANPCRPRNASTSLLHGRSDLRGDRLPRSSLGASVGMRPFVMRPSSGDGSPCRGRAHHAPRCTGSPIMRGAPPAAAAAPAPDRPAWPRPAAPSR